jgi:hypothetical protein
MRINGKCHCGNIAFALEWRPEPVEIPARACTCSFCTRHGGVWTACPVGVLRIARRAADHVSFYEFDTKTAQFHVCTICGVVPAATSLIDGRIYAVVNVNTFENVPREMLRLSAATFDDEGGIERLARRKRNWIGDVAFVDQLDSGGV